MDTMQLSNLQAVRREETNLASYYIKENGKKKEIESHMTEEQFAQVFGQEDQTVKKMHDSLRKDANQIFDEFYQEEVPEKDRFEEKISETFKKSFRSKTVSFMTKGKRAEKAREKMRLVNHLKKEQQNLLDVTLANRQLAKEVAGSDDRQVDYKTLFPTEEGQEAVRNWYFVNLNNSKKHNNNMFFRSRESYNSTLPLILEQVASVKLADLYFNSQRDFASSFAKKYQDICKIASAEYFYKDYLKLQQGLNYASISEINFKIQACKQLKTLYEDNMALITSPYYTLLGKSDLTPYLGENGEEVMNREIKDEALKDYIRLYKKVNAHPFFYGNGEKAAGNNLTTLKISIFQKQADRDDKLCREKLKEIEDARKYTGGEDKIDENTSLRNRMKQIYEDRKKWLQKDLPAEDREFIAQKRATSSAGHVNAIDPDAFHALELRILDIRDKGIIYGEKIAPEHKAELDAAVTKLIEKRRAFIASAHAMDFVHRLSGGFDCDLRNPIFLETETGKEMKKYFINDYKGRDDPLAYLHIAEEEVKDDYNSCFNEIYTILYKYGYPISEDHKYEKQLDDMIRHPDNERAVYLTKVIENQSGKLPTFTVNGREFTCYKRNHELAKLNGRNITLSEEDEKVILPILSDMEKQMKRYAFTNAGFSNEKGIKSYVGLAMTKKNKEILKGLEDKLAPYMDKLG